MPTGHEFPNITPSQRVYTPAAYPQQEFQGLNGAVTVLQYGATGVDSKLEMTFQNISDTEATQILGNYEKVNSGRDPKNGAMDYVEFAEDDPIASGIDNAALKARVTETRTKGRLRYRYASPPVITSTFPGRSTVQVSLRGYLEGANST